MSDSPLRLLKLSLNHEAYTKHKSLFLDSFFSRPVDKLWTSIKSAHQEYNRDLTTDDVYELCVVQNGTLTKAAKEALKDLLDSVKDLPPVGNDIALEVLKSAYSHELGRELIEHSYSLIEGKDFDITKAKDILTQIEGGCLPETETLEYVPTDVEELLAQFDDTPYWRFNIPQLQKDVGGLPPGTFTTVFARPECGKSALCLYLACGPSGFCDQGAKILIVCNEELAKRNMIRAVSSYTGLTAEQIKADPKKANKEWSKIAPNIRMVDAGGWTTDNIRAYCTEFMPDIVIIDQTDKLRDNPEEEGHVRLRSLYTAVREIGKEHNCAIIGVSQASNDAEGKMYLDYSMLENSKTGKPAECDLIIGVGANSIVAKNDGGEFMRGISLCKNKFSGIHSTFVVMIEPQVSRFKE